MNNGMFLIGLPFVPILYFGEFFPLFSLEAVQTLLSVVSHWLLYSFRPSLIVLLIRNCQNSSLRIYSKFQIMRSNCSPRFQFLLPSALLHSKHAFRLVLIQGILPFSVSPCRVMEVSLTVKAGRFSSLSYLALRIFELLQAFHPCFPL